MAYTAGTQLNPFVENNNNFIVEIIIYTGLSENNKQAHNIIYCNTTTVNTILHWKQNSIRIFTLIIVWKLIKLRYT